VQGDQQTNRVRNGRRSRPVCKPDLMENRGSRADLFNPIPSICGQIRGGRKCINNDAMFVLTSEL
jgi:hypothetical protein